MLNVHRTKKLALKNKKLEKKKKPNGIMNRSRFEGGVFYLLYFIYFILIFINNLLRLVFP